MSCLEPAANRGYMACALKEFFADVHSSDIMDYGYCEVKDFLKNTYENNSFDWVITNPPFRLAGEFINEAIKVSRVGVAMLVRTVFVEGIKRYNNLYSFNPPFRVAQFSERVPMIKGRVNKNATTATSYCWMIWVKNGSKNTELFWIPPCRKKLEKASDYQLPMERKNGTDNSD